MKLLHWWLARQTTYTKLMQAYAQEDDRWLFARIDAMPLHKKAMIYRLLSGIGKPSVIKQLRARLSKIDNDQEKKLCAAAIYTLTHTSTEDSTVLSEEGAQLLAPVFSILDFPSPKAGMPLREQLSDSLEQVADLLRQSSY